MTGRLAALEARIASIDELHEMVTAMRGMSASRREQARAALTGVSAYADTILAAFGEVLPLLPTAGVAVPADARASSARRALVLFLSEQGFVGTFNERLIEAARVPAPPTALFVLGSRGARLAAQHGIEVSWSGALPGHLPQASRPVQRLSEALFRRLAEGDLDGIEMLYARSLRPGLDPERVGTAEVARDGAPAGGVEVVRERLFPVDPARAGTPGPALPPLVNLPAERLVEQVAEAYVGAELTRALVEAFAAENAARVTAMQQASRNIDERLDALRQTARSLRQAEITTELLDVVMGSEAANGTAD